MVLAVLSSLSSIFSALLEDSLFWSSFPTSEYLRSASRTLRWCFFLAVLFPLLSICAAPRGLFILVVFSRFRVSAQRLEDSCRTLRWRFFLAVLFLLPSICAVPRGLFILIVFSRFRVSVQRLEDSCRTLPWRLFLAVLFLLPIICAAPRGLFILVAFSRFRVSAQHLEDSCRTLPRLEDSCRTRRGPFILAVLSSLSSIFSALLEDSLFRSYFPAFEYLRSASRTLSGVPAQGPSTWVNLRYLEYLRKGLNQRSS